MALQGDGRLDKSGQRTAYFIPVCRSVFDAYFQSRGFHLRECRPHAVSYRGRSCWIRIHYLPEELPPFSPMLTIGVDGSAIARAASCVGVPATRTHWVFRTVGRLLNRDLPPPLVREIGLWDAIPEGDPAASYHSWRFASAEELSNVARRLLEEVIEPYARPLWEEPRQLRDLLWARERDLLSGRDEGRTIDGGFAWLAERERAIRERM